MNSTFFSIDRALACLIGSLALTAGSTALAQPITTNTIAGSISVPGERDVFTFSLTNRARYYFDSLTNLSTLHWSLEGPTGQLINNRGFNVSDAGNAPVISLVPGFYRLTVDADGTNTPSYAFRLGEPNRRQFADARYRCVEQARARQRDGLYQFTANAGDPFVFDRQFLTPGQNVWWRLLDPFGNEVFTSGFNDVGTVTQQVTGTYTLLIEGYANNDAPAIYSFIADRGVSSPLPP